MKRKNLQTKQGRLTYEAPDFITVRVALEEGFAASGDMDEAFINEEDLF